MHELVRLGMVNAVAAACLAVPAWLVSRWGRRPALAHVLWLLVLLKLVVPLLWPVQIVLPESSISAGKTTPIVADRSFPRFRWPYHHWRRKLRLCPSRRSIFPLLPPELPEEEIVCA